MAALSFIRFLLRLARVLSPDLAWRVGAGLGDAFGALPMRDQGRAREHLALYRKNEDLVAIGAYQKGGNPALDQAIALQEPLGKFTRQLVDEHSPRAQTFTHLKTILTP